MTLRFFAKRRGALFALAFLPAALSACSGGPGGAVETTDAPPPVARSMPAAPLDPAAPVSRIAFGSCAKQGRDQSFWNAIAEAKPDLFVFLGDNVYGDARTDDPSMPELRAAYDELARSEPFEALRRTTPLLTVWDDHDYGRNDGGGDFPLKEEAERIFEHVWALPEDDPRRGRRGIYHAVTMGEEGRRVQVVLLDTRYFRSPLTATDMPGAPGKERYLPSADPDQTMLGETQEAWLEGVLGEPADLRILVTSVQLLADGHGWEAWATLPEARERLYEIVARSGAEDVIVVSGDRHAGGLYAREDLPVAIHEMTASSLNDPAAAWGPASYEEAGPHRFGPLVREANFGTVDIDWEAREAVLRLRDMEDGVFRAVTVPF